MKEDCSLPGSRSITSVKVDQTVPGAKCVPYIRISWLDGHGQRQEVLLTEQRAAEVITDLHACALVGDGDRYAYLIGFIRAHTLQQRGA